MTCGGEDYTKLPGRKVTDWLWLIIFIIFCFGMVFIATFAIVYGNPMRLVYGYDSFGNMCGHRNEPMGSLSLSGWDLTEKKYLFYFNIGKPHSTLKICVRECPTHLIQTRSELANFAVETGSFLCRYDISINEYTQQDPIAKNKSIIITQNKSIVTYSEDYGPCPTLPVYPSSPLLNRCIPQSAQNVAADIVYNIHAFLNNFDLFQQVLTDVYASWKELIILAAVACILSAFMVLIFHFLVAVVFWIVFIGVGLACCVGTGLLWWTYIDIRNQLNSTPDEQLLEDVAKNERAFLCYAVIASIFTVIFLSILFCFKREMPQVKNLFKEAASCMFDLPCLFFQPIWTLTILFCFLLFWIYIILSLATAIFPSKQDIDVRGSNSSFPIVFTIIDHIDPSWVRYLWWYYVFALIWISEVIVSCQQMIMSGTIANWYFTKDRSNLSCPLWKMSINVVFYHLGSVAKGSFLITLFKLPRVIMAYIKQRISTGESTKCEKCCEASCCCCLWIFEKFLKYMNHNAYAVVAMNGENFCPAAREAFAALIEQAPLVATVNGVGDFVLFLGKFLITATTGIIGLLVMKLNPSLNFYAIPVLISCVVAYFVAHCVLSLLEMIIDTLTLCYCEDKKREYATTSLKNLFKTNDDPDDGIEMEEFLPPTSV